MHEIDQTTEQMVRSVLAYAENRLRMDPVPLDKGTQPAADLYKVLNGVIRDRGRAPDEVLGIYSSVIAPSIVSADSPRFLGFIPAAPTKASLLFDMPPASRADQGARPRRRAVPSGRLGTGGLRQVGAIAARGRG